MKPILRLVINLMTATWADVSTLIYILLVHAASLLYLRDINVSSGPFVVVVFGISGTSVALYAYVSHRIHRNHGSWNKKT